MGRSGPFMLRIGAIFIVICMVLIAGAVGAVMYLAFGMSGAESTIVAVAALTAMALYNAVTTRLRDRSDLGNQIADLSRGAADLSRQLAEAGRRLAAIEGQGQSAADTARAATAPISAELSELGSLVKQLAETVAAHEAALASGTRKAEPARPGCAGTWHGRRCKRRSFAHRKPRGVARGDPQRDRCPPHRHAPAAGGHAAAAQGALL